MNPWFDQKLVFSKRLLGVNSWFDQKLVFSKGLLGANSWFDQELVFSKRFLPTHCWNDINDFSCENWSWLKITTLSGIKRMVGTSLKSWDIIFYDKNNFVNTCWPHDAIFLLWTFLEILKNQHFHDFSTSLKVNKSQQMKPIISKGHSTGYFLTFFTFDFL